MRRLLEEPKQLKNQSLSKVLLKIFALVLCFSIVLFNMPLTEQNIASSASSDEEKMPETVFLSREDIRDLKNKYPRGPLSSENPDANKEIRIQFGRRQTFTNYMEDPNTTGRVLPGSLIWLLAGVGTQGVKLFSEKPVLGYNSDDITFQRSLNNQIYLDEQTNVRKDVYANHWGASTIRQLLNDRLISPGVFFTAGEIPLILPSSIVSEDYKNSVNYTTQDKLYLPRLSNYTISSGPDKGRIVYYLNVGDNETTQQVMANYGAHLAMSRSPDQNNTTVLGLDRRSYSGANASLASIKVDNSELEKISAHFACQLDISSIACLSQACAYDIFNNEQLQTNGNYMPIEDGTPHTVHLRTTDLVGPTGQGGYNIGVDVNLAPGNRQGCFLVIVAIGLDGRAYKYVKQVNRTEVINTAGINGLPSGSTKFKIAKAWLELPDVNKKTIIASEPITIIPATHATSNTTSEKISCEVGKQVNLDYKIYPTNATNKPEITYNSTDDNIATVSADGVVTGVNRGTTTIGARCTINGERYTATYEVTVTKPATGVTLNKTTTTIAAGKSETLIATVSPSDTSDSKEIEWSSSNTSVATVSTGGVVNGLKVGTATITAKLKANTNLKATCTVTVTNPDILATGVSISPSTASIAVGNTKALTATVSPSNTTQSKLVTWSSSDSAIASVSTSGVVTAKKAGDAIITATLRANINLKGTCRVTVTQPVTGLTLDKTQLKMVPGISSKLTATVSPSDATNKTVTWEVQSQTGGSSDVVSVDSQGNVTAKKAGTAFVIARAGSYSKTCTVTVVAKSISISPTSVSIEAGSNKQLTATVSPTDVTFEKAITWTSNKSSVATVSSSGLVTAVGPGTAIITAQLTKDNTVTATRTVTVTRAATGVTLNKTTATMAVGGSKMTLSATVLPSDTSQNKTVTWSSSDSEVATVSTSGEVTAKKAGYAIITATLNANANLKATCRVTVTQPVTGLTLTPDLLKMVPNTTAQLTATVLPSDATNKTVTWGIQSGSSTIATVSSSGLVTAKSQGTVIVVARAGSYSKTCTINVVNKGISISPTSVSIEAGRTQKLTATVSPSDADVDFNDAITWTSNKHSVATVSSSGLVTAVAPGTAIITAQLTNDNTVTATRTVTVTRAATGVTLNKTTATMAVGGSKMTLSATVLPSDTSQNKTVTWSSSDSTVATVSTSGEVTAKKAGDAIITATLNANTNLKATCAVNVTQPVTKVTLNKTQLTMVPNTTAQLTATVSPSDATNKTVTWKVQSQTGGSSDVVSVDSQGNVRANKAGTAFVIASADGKNATCTVTVEKPSISLAESLTIVEGQTKTLTATVSPTDVTFEKAVTWSSNNSSVATINTTSGLLTAVAPGPATITATLVSDPTVTATCTVTVEKLVIPLVSFAIKNGNSPLSLRVGDRGTMEIDHYQPENTTQREMSWSSDDEQVATVNSVTGEVTGLKKGVAYIKATCVENPDLHRTRIVIVEPAIPTGITINKNSTTIEIGNSETLTATVSPPGAEGYQGIIWESSDSSIASVESDVDENDGAQGTITAKSGGTVTIKAYVLGLPEIEATCTVTVPQPVAEVTLNKTQLKMVRWGTEKLTATVLPEDATDKTVTWKAQSETGGLTDVVSVDSQGNVEANKAGTAIVIASAGGKTAQCTIWVENKSVEVLPSSTIIEVGEKETLTATVSPADVEFDKTITWSSDRSDVARVDSITGEVTAVRPGTATITAKLVNDVMVGGSSCTVTVTQSAVGITLSKTSTSIEAGDSERLIATILPANTTQDKTVLWSSNNEAAATVDEDGNITAVKAGEAIITATLRANPDITAECAVTVTQRITGVELDKTQLKMIPGGSTKLNATILPEDATDKTINWIVQGGSGVISIDQEGNITANGAGIAIVVVTAADGKQLARCTVFVEEKSIELSESSISIEIGGTKTLTATVLPGEAEFDKIITWSTDNEQVATVDAASGLVTAKKTGEARITAALESDPNVTATCIVTVTQVATGMSLNKTSTKLVVGTGEKLIATILPEDATQDKTILWSSDNEQVATVDAASGLVTAKKEGEATITATLQANPTITATCQVTTVDLSQQITSVELDETILRMVPTENKQISATVYPTSLAPEDKVLIFESNDTRVATVDQTGRVTAVKPGFTTVIIKAENHVRPLAYCTIFVEKSSISLDQTEMRLMVGENDGQLIATTMPRGLAVDWSSSDTNVVTVRGTINPEDPSQQLGRVHAVASGKAEITATLQSDPTIKARCWVAVNPRITDLALDMVTAIPESGYFASGDTVKFKVTYTREGLEYYDPFNISTVGSDGGIISNVNHQKEFLLTIGKTYDGRDSGEVSAIVEVNGNNLRAERNINFAAYKATLDKKVIEVEKGKTIKMGATIKPEDESSRDLSWAMGATTNGVFEPSNKNVATVDGEGNLTGVNTGEDTLVVRVLKDDGTPSEASYDQCVVKVVSPRIERVELNKNMLEMVKGEGEQLTATIFPESARERTLTFESSDANVATVDQSGNITATGAGFAVILVKETNGDGTPLAYCSVWVVEKSVTLDQAAVNMLVGSRRSLIATVSPQDEELEWESRDNDIATVANGVIQAKAVGPTIITAYLASDRNVKAECAVTVTAVSVAAQSIELSASSVSLSAGGTETLSATVLPEGTTDDTLLTWRSINESIAIVDQNGVITARKPGRTIIEVKLNNNPGITAECEVIVAQAEVPAQRINLNKASATINTNENVVLEATVEPSDTTDDKALTWTSNKPSVATVKNGAVTGISKGKAIITVALASRPNVTKTCEITVEQPITKVTLNKTMGKMIVGDNEGLTATIEPSDATNKDLIWESSDRSVATVVNGNITAVGVGVATIIVKATDGTMLAFYTVWVVEKSVILDQTDMDMLVGDSKTLRATTSPENAELVWENGNDDIATVTNGVVTAKAVGSTTIRVSFRTNPEINATCLVVVKKRP